MIQKNADMKGTSVEIREMLETILLCDYALGIFQKLFLCTNDWQYNLNLNYGNFSS